MLCIVRVIGKFPATRGIWVNIGYIHVGRPMMKGGHGPDEIVAVP